jgi:hypothetical protein
MADAGAASLRHHLADPLGPAASGPSASGRGAPATRPWVVVTPRCARGITERSGTGQSPRACEASRLRATCGVRSTARSAFRISG